MVPVPSKRICRQLPEIRVAADRIREPRLQSRRRSVLAGPPSPHVLRQRSVMSSDRHVEYADRTTILIPIGLGIINL